jgi:C-terminal processing protease CtpA/Prc
MKPFFDIYKKSYYGIRIKKAKTNLSSNSLLYISELLKNGKADSLGIQLKDEVIKVNEEVVNENNYEALLDSIPKSRSLTIRKKDDSIVKIEFERDSLIN